MNKKGKNIEQLYRESFEDFRVEPSSGLWKRISSRLAWKTFIKFNPTTFNAYYLTGILALSIAGALWITNPNSGNNHEIKEITINKTIETPVITPVQDNKTEPKEVTTQEESRKMEAGSRKQEANNQKSDSSIHDPKLVTPDSELVTRNPKLVTLNPKPVTPKLATPHPKPKTLYPELVTRNSQPVTPEPSNQSPEPWPNTMDSLFFSYNSTAPEYKIQFPNAFTPNPNGPTNGYYTPGIPNNNVFHPVYKGVVEYHLSIFNRRGELIFESNDINMGWDGYINDRLAAQGVYVWKARGRYSNGQSFTKFGNVMLIKK